MSVAQSPFLLVQRGSMFTLVFAVFLSLFVHLAVGVGAGGYFGSIFGGNHSSDSEIDMEMDSQQVIPPMDELRLGLEESSVASINWLGVIDNPELGDVPVAEVEQADFTQQVGDSAVETSPQAAAEPQPEALVEQPSKVEEPVGAAANPSEQIVLELEPSESAPIQIQIQPEEIDQSIAEEDVEKVEKLEEKAVEPKPQPVMKPVMKPVENKTEESAPKKVGKSGVLSEKESSASILKRALPVDAKSLHKPIAGDGLEITTVEPKFSAAVRFTHLPRNPVLIIRFDASGKVKKVLFHKDGLRVFDTGSKGVDEPLINAVYKWRAKGKAIDALDPDDPNAVVEISMRIVFRKESKKP